MKTQIKQFLRLPLAMIVAVSVGSVAIPSLAFNPADVARVAPNADLLSADLSGADLRSRDLQGANLQGANLQGASLLFANLQGASLLFANLQGANLQGANLQGANLQGANLQGAIIILPSRSTSAVSLQQLAQNEERLSIERALLSLSPSLTSLDPDNFTTTNLQSATYNSSTKFPDGFDPARAGMRLVP